jgi:hypothetical protein
MAVALVAWSTTCPLPGRVSKLQIQSEYRTLSYSSLKATIYCADAISDGEAKSGLESPSIKPPQLAASFISNEARYVAYWHLADNPAAPAFVRFWTKADNGGFWPVMVCPLMTHKRHWLCTAAMVLMPVSAPIKVLV